MTLDVCSTAKNHRINSDLGSFGSPGTGDAKVASAGAKRNDQREIRTLAPKERRTQ
jgi:hypothetical protein